jgi:hypothetical protein
MCVAYRLGAPSAAHRRLAARGNEANAGLLDRADDPPPVSDAAGRRSSILAMPVEAFCHSLLLVGVTQTETLSQERIIRLIQLV